MKSSSGEHFIALDHIRALAAFLVFSWHFTHAQTGTPVPFEYTPNLSPFSFIDEGHTGVALFMTLSGYLFSKLLDGKRIIYHLFIWNRVLRLLPLLSIVVLIKGLPHISSIKTLYWYFLTIIPGLALPSLPNGGWSITVEFHYYLILPIFLWMIGKSKYLPLSIIATAILLRIYLYNLNGEIQSLAYWTLIGRIDQFALGTMIYHFRSRIVNRHFLILNSLFLFSLFYWYFNARGGFYLMPSYPSPSTLWVIIPTLEGLVYGLAICWYDNSFTANYSPISRFISRIGTYSYSIYLLHFFLVFKAADFINQHIMNISNFYIATLWSLLCFILMYPISYLSFRFIEKPCLKLRKRYTINQQ